MQAIPVGIKALVILISNEMPDENTHENRIQPTYSVISSLTSGQGIYDERKRNLHPWVRVGQAGRPLPPRTLRSLGGLKCK